MALIVHRYKDIQIEAPWANRAQLDRILHDPVLLREQLDLVRRFQRQAFISFIDGVHHVQRLLAARRLELEFKTTRGKQTLDVMYTVDEGDKGLALESSDKVKLLTQENGIVKDTVQLRAIRPGRFYLNVFITMNNQSHIVSIPVQIGPEMQTMQRSSIGVQ